MEKPAWSAVFATALTAAALSTAEALPASILTPIADALQISEGMAGQMVTASAVMGFLTSLTIVTVVRTLDRRRLVLLLLTLLALSNLIVATAPNLALLLVGRMLLGMVVGGFWTFSASLTMRLVPQALVPRAFSILFGGTSLARILAAPLASYLEPIIGWRNIFLLAAGLALIALLWQTVSLPSLPARGQRRFATLFLLLKRPHVRMGMVSILLSFAGVTAAFTYLRPFLESVTGVDVNQLSAILLGVGIASFVGTSVAGTLLKRNLPLTLTVMPLLLSLLAGALIGLGQIVAVAAILVTLWGFFSSIIPVGWSTWLTRAVPDEAESGGGLLVATIQLAIMTGAALGGFVIDKSGVLGPIVVGGSLLLLCSLVTMAALRRPHAQVVSPI